MLKQRVTSRGIKVWTSPRMPQAILVMQDAIEVEVQDQFILTTAGCFPVV
jgi:hypothetical protein